MDGSMIKVARKKAGLTQAELGAKLGVSQSMVGAWETNIRKPKLDTIERISKVLEVDIYEAFGKNPYWERICKLSEQQRAKGMETYGQGLESNPAAMLKRIEHLQEELIDGLMYCEWIKDKVMELEGNT